MCVDAGKHAGYSEPWHALLNQAVYCCNVLDFQVQCFEPHMCIIQGFVTLEMHLLSSLCTQGKPIWAPPYLSSIIITTGTYPSL